jgi:hypothetical protein
VRLSCDVGDPSYPEYARITAEGGKVRVFIGDAPLDRSIMADEEMGVAVVYRTKNGEPVLTERGNAIERDVIRGNVRIVIERPEPA